MSKQNYSNHRKSYPLHHFIFYPLVIAALIIAIGQMRKEAGNPWTWALIAILAFLIALLSFMMRQHYSLGNQDRIIRLEMRFRYYVLTQQRFEPIEAQLSFSQIAALRFASDAELPALIKRTLAEGLSSTDIKKSIKDWQADDMRV